MSIINRKLSKKGFSLIELMIAVTILAMAIFGIFHAYSVGFLGMADTRDRTVATNHVQEKMEELKNADFDTVVDEASSQIVGDIKFSRSVNVEYINGSTNLIIAGPTNLKRITTAVNWTDRNGVTKKVESSMLLQNTQFTPGDAARISLYADPYNMVLPGSSSTTIIAVIKDKSGNTVFDWDGSDVTFTIISEVSVEGEPVGGQLGTLSDYAVTPVKGIASVVFTSSVTELEGTVIVEASVTTSASDGLTTFTDTIAIDVTWGAVKIELIPNPSSIYADSITQSTIIAILENAAGVRVFEALNDITFTVAGEGILIGPTTKPANETYNGDTGGVATILLQSTTTPGIATVTASSPGLLSDSCNVQTSGEPAGIALSASPNPMYSDDTSTVTVTIVDENGVPVIPATAITIDLEVSEGILLDSSLGFNNVSVQTTNYSPFPSTEGTVTITASGAFTGSIDISVELKLEADHIDLNANPPSIPAVGGISTITATIKDEWGITVHNFDGDVSFSMITDTEFVLGMPFDPTNTIECINGVATIQLYSGGMPGTCRVKAENISLPSTWTTIDVGFYTTADHILLTAVPDHIPVGGGNEGTTKLTAYVKDENNVTVYNYKGNVLFTFEQGFNHTAKFKFIDQSNFSVPVFHGSASVYILSLNNSGDAEIKAEDDSFGILTSDELILYIQKVLSEPTIPNVEYDANGKGVSFDIEVQGGDITIDRMKVTWSPDNLEELTNVTIDVDGVGSNNSDEMINGVDFDIEAITLSEEIIISPIKITLTFDSSIEDKDISIIFYPADGESSCAGEYVIDL